MNTTPPVAPQPPSRLLPTILKNVTANWVGLVVNMGLSFVIAPITVNALGNVYYGIWTLLMQFTGYLWLFDFGVRESVVKYVAQYHASGEKEQLNSTVRTAVSLYSMVALLAMVGVTALTIAMPYVFNIPEDAVSTARLTAFITGSTIAQSFVFNVFVGVVMGLQQFYQLTRVGLLLALFRTGLVYLLLTNGYGIVALSVVQFVMSLALSVLVYRLCVKELPYLTVRLIRPPREAAMKLLNYGKYVLVANVGDKLVFSTDSLVIAAFLPMSSLTFFAIGGSLVEYFRSFISSMGSLINPLASSLEARQDKALLARVFVGGSKAAMLLGLPVCIGFIILGERFITLWMGPEYGPPSGRVLAVLAAGYLIGLPYASISAVMYGLGQHRYVAYSRIAEGVANLILSILLIKWMGVLGVAVGTAIPHAIIVAGYLPSVLPRLFPINLRDYYVWTYLRPLVAAIPFALVCWYVDRIVQPANLITFMIAVGISLVAYVVPTWFLALTDPERMRATDALLRRIRTPSPAAPVVAAANPIGNSAPLD